MKNTLPTYKDFVENNLSEKREGDELFDARAELIDWWKKNSSTPAMKKLRPELEKKFNLIFQQLDEIIDKIYES